MLLSVVIPTKNEERNITSCVRSFAAANAAGRLERVVIDNFSTDRTAELARQEGARVVLIGPERSAQRNRGGLVEAAGDFLFFVDADMQVPPETLEEILGLLGSSPQPDALYVRESMAGRGWWARVRNFERSFYDATCIDGLRVIRRRLFAEVGGFDQKLYAGEDWDLDRRLLAKAPRVQLTQHALIHNEGEFSLRGHLRKKRYYARNFDAYCAKWNYDEVIRRQFGLRYRLWTVFMENGKWRRSLAHPLLLGSIWFYKLLVGAVFFAGTRRHRQGGSRDA